MTQTKLKESVTKSASHVHYSIPSPKFSSVSLYDQPFSRYSTFVIFPLTPMLKFKNAIIYLILDRSPEDL